MGSAGKFNKNRINPYGSQLRKVLFYSVVYAFFSGPRAPPEQVQLFVQLLRLHENTSEGVFEIEFMRIHWSAAENAERREIVQVL